MTDSSRRARKKAQVDETRQALVDPNVRPTGGRVPLKARTFNPTNSTGTVVVQFGRFNNRDEPGKDYAIGDLPSREARERLVELEYDDEDRISRLRVTGRGRLYGFRRATRFYALWWDPEHEIYPSPKRHT